MDLEILRMRLDEQAAGDAASPAQIDAVRRCLESASSFAPGSSAQRALIDQAAHLVSDSWPFQSEAGKLVLDFAAGSRRTR